MSVRHAKLDDLDTIYKLDTDFYKDSFFTKKDIKRMINANRVYINARDDAYVSILPISRNSIYIISLAGTATGRIELLKWLIRKYKTLTGRRRIYTHGKKTGWGMDLLVKIGFIINGRGDPKVEPIKFDNYIKKLWVYELYI